MKIKVLLALGGAVAALAGGALLFNYIASQSEKKYGLFDVELKEIGNTIFSHIFYKFCSKFSLQEK